MTVEGKPVQVAFGRVKRVPVRQTPTPRVEGAGSTSSFLAAITNAAV